MITTRKELKEYIAADAERNASPKPSIFRILLGIESESYYVRKLLRNLRYLEYHTNNKSLRSKILRLFFSVKHKRLSKKYSIYLPINRIGKGLRIPHITSTIVLGGCLKMGDYCTVNRHVVVGFKGNFENGATIGNNVELTLGCRIIGKVNIGDNVAVCQNTVVIKDVPANAIVSGVPAQIIKIRG